MAVPRAGSFALDDGASVAVAYAATAKVVGFAGDEIRQRRRIAVKH